MKIVLWIGKDANHKALACKINAVVPLGGIVVESPCFKRKYSIKKIAEKIFERIFLREIDNAWNSLLRNYEKKYPEYPDVPLIKVENINNAGVFKFSTEIKPDLIIVSGTRLIVKKMLNIQPEIGILNLHTGLSPYVKGGPNCTNWCISKAEFSLIGNTVLWLDQGIDSGDIFFSENIPLTGNENLRVIHEKVMKHAHDLLIKAISNIKAGKNQKIKQSTIGNGVTYKNKQWGIYQKISLCINIRKLHGRGPFVDKKELKVFPEILNNE